MSQDFFLYDDTEQTITRYVSFMSENYRHDLAIITTKHFYGKKLVVNIQTNRSAIVGQDDLKEEGYVAYAFGISEEEAEELLPFLEQTI